MENVFSNIARKATTLSPIMENRDKISIDEIIDKYPDGVTITGFDVISTSSDTFPVVVFKEDAKSFAFGGAILHNIIEGWVEAFSGDIEAASTALEKSGGCKMKFTKSKTKSGNNITLVEIV